MREDFEVNVSLFNLGMKCIMEEGFMNMIPEKISAIFNSTKWHNQTTKIKHNISKGVKNINLKGVFSIFNNPYVKKIFGLKQVILVLVVLFSMSLILAGMKMSDRPNAYVVTWSDQEVGIVELEEMAEEAYEMALAQVQKEVGKKVKVDTKIQTEFIHAPQKTWSEVQDVADSIRKQILSDTDHYKVEAMAVTIGDQVMILEDIKTAEAVLEKIKQPYISEERDFVEVSFVEEVKFTPVFAKLSKIITAEDMWTTLTATEESKKIYTIVAGDNLWTISQKNELSIDELLKMNPELTEDSLLQIGQELTLLIPKPKLSVQTKEEIVYTEAITKPVEYKKDDTQFKDYRKVVEEGKDGNKEITAHIVYINGYEDHREVIEEKIIEEAIPSVIVVGTKELPPKRATGSFRRPISGGRLTSGFGPRWGSFHAGVDLATSYGTPIYASDGGKVIFAGWNSSYGKTVKIDHGNGFVTWYAHCSSINVTVGTKVAKGDRIAAIGSTGYSTGPHVHFEIRKNGKAQNPMNYIR